MRIQALWALVYQTAGVSSLLQGIPHHHLPADREMLQFEDPLGKVMIPVTKPEACQGLPDVDISISPWQGNSPSCCCLRKPKWVDF